MLVVLFLIGLAATLLAMPVLVRWLARRQVLDVPNERSSHDRPTPRGGGLGIVLPVVIALALLRPVDGSGSGGFAMGLLVGAVGLAILGFWDDLASLGAVSRLLVQGALAGLGVGLAGLGMDALALPGLPPLALGDAGWFVSWVFVLGFTNMFNFMDGINGIAGTQALVAGVGLGAAGVLGADPALAGAMALLAGASLGFLPYNFPRARVFMGDVGSLPVGFALALSTLQARGSGQVAVPIWVVVLFIWPFLFEATTTLLLRVARGHNPMRAHRTHLYQRLVVHGWSHRAVTSAYAVAMVLCVAAALVCLADPSSRTSAAIFWGVALGSVLVSALATRWVGRGEG